MNKVLIFLPAAGRLVLFVSRQKDKGLNEARDINFTSNLARESTSEWIHTQPNELNQQEIIVMDFMYKQIPE